MLCASGRWSLRCGEHRFCSPPNPLLSLTTTSPALACPRPPPLYPLPSQVAPDLLTWYYNQSLATGSDYFVLPPSGHLYAYPGLMQEVGTVLCNGREGVGGDLTNMLPLLLGGCFWPSIFFFL